MPAGEAAASSLSELGQGASVAAVFVQVKLPAASDSAYIRLNRFMRSPMKVNVFS